MQWTDLPQDISATSEKGVTTIICPSISDFMSIYQEHFARQRNLIFRGHADSSWQLESSLTREMRMRLEATQGNLSELRSRAEFEFPAAFFEFLETLANIGDREIRDQISEYFELWEKAYMITPHSFFERLITGDDVPLRQVIERDRLRIAEFQLLAIAQHFGMPTPLLDWSRSPFVAWFFALRGQLLGEPAVLAISPNLWKSSSSKWLRKQADKIRQQIDAVLPEQATSILDFAHPKDALAERRSALLGEFETEFASDIVNFQHFPANSHFNDRLQAQQGMLTKHSVGFSLEAVAHILSEDVNETLIWKFVLTEDSRDKAMTHLRMMNITGFTLFPGLVGAAQFGLDSLRFESYSAKNWPNKYGTA